MIRIDAMWLCVQPIDMRAGADRQITSVIAVRMRLFESAGQRGGR